MIWSKTDDGVSIEVTVPDQHSLLTDIAQRFETNAGFSVATLNLDHVVKLSRDPVFRTAYGQQTHVTADGNPIVWLSRLAGQKDIELIPGSELIEPLAALASEKGVPVALFGATEAALSATERALKAKFDGLNIVLTLAPPMGFDPQGSAADDAIIALGESGARLVFLAIGAPKQEVFAARAQSQLPMTGFLSIGAGLDFIAGSQTRAPEWVRKIAAEWLWRLVRNPRRLAARYGACILKLPGLTLRALTVRITGQLP